MFTSPDSSRPPRPYFPRGAENAVDESEAPTEPSSASHVMDHPNYSVDEATLELAGKVAEHAKHTPAARVTLDEIKAGVRNVPEHAHPEVIEAAEYEADDQADVPTEDMVTEKIASEPAVNGPTQAGSEIVADSSGEWNMTTPDYERASTGDYPQYAGATNHAMPTERQGGDIVELGPTGNPIDDQIQREIRANAAAREARGNAAPQPVSPQPASAESPITIQEKFAKLQQSIAALQQQLEQTSGWRLLRKAGLRRDIAQLQKHQERYLSTYPELSVQAQPAGLVVGTSATAETAAAAEGSPAEKPETGAQEMLDRFDRLVKYEFAVRQSAQQAKGPERAHRDMQLRAVRRQIEETRTAPLITAQQRGLDLVGQYMDSLAAYQPETGAPAHIEAKQPAEQVVVLRDSATRALEQRTYMQDPAGMTDAQVAQEYTRILSDRERLLAQRPNARAPIIKQKTWEANFRLVEERRRVLGAAQHQRKEAAAEQRTAA